MQHLLTISNAFCTVHTGHLRAKLPPVLKIIYLPSKIPAMSPSGVNAAEIFKRTFANFLGPSIELNVSHDVSKNDKPMAIAKIATKNIE